MAKKDDNLVIIRETLTITPLGLANVTAIKGVQAVAITDDFRIIKTEFSAVASGITSGQGFDWNLFLVNDDLTAVQIAQSISAQGPKNAADTDLKEDSNRFVKRMGVLGIALGSETVKPFVGLENSPLIEKVVRWSFSKGVGWNWALWQNTGSAITTGALVKIVATHYGVWIR